MGWVMSYGVIKIVIIQNQHFRCSNPGFFSKINIWTWNFFYCFIKYYVFCWELLFTGCRKILPVMNPITVIKYHLCPCVQHCAHSLTRIITVNRSKVLCTFKVSSLISYSSKLTQEVHYFVGLFRYHAVSADIICCQSKEWDAMFWSEGKTFGIAFSTVVFTLHI